MPLDQDHLRDAAGGVMPFGAHLDELRSRLIKALVVPVALALAVFMGASHVRGFLVRPLMDALAAEGQPTNLQVLSPTESLMVDLQISIWAAVVVSLPWILWQLWKFVAPGLYSHERRFARFLVPLSSILALAGLTGLYLAMPYMLRVLISFGNEAPRTVALAAADAAPGGNPAMQASTRPRPHPARADTAHTPMHATRNRPTGPAHAAAPAAGIPDVGLKGVSGPATGIDRPCTESSAGARGASDEERGS